MKWLVFTSKNNSFFIGLEFGKHKNLSIFATAIRKYIDLLEKWQSGRLRQS